MSNPTACGVGSFLGGVAPGIIAKGLMPILIGIFFTTAGLVSTVGADDCSGSLLSALFGLGSGILGSSRLGSKTIKLQLVIKKTVCTNTTT